MPRGPILDTGSKPAGVGGTISGVVKVSGTDAPPGSRKVTAVDVSSGARHETSTSTLGGYTLKVPAGKYRMEVELRAGESLAEQPGEFEIGRSDLDASRDLVIAVRNPERR